MEIMQKLRRNWNKNMKEKKKEKKLNNSLLINLLFFSDVGTLEFVQNEAPCSPLVHLHLRV